MKRLHLFALTIAVTTAMGMFASQAQADLLAYWSANNTDDETVVPNDFGDPFYEAFFAGGAGYAGDGLGITGQAGDNAMEFLGTDEDFAEVEIPDINYEQITIAGWLKGAQTGAWSGIFQTRDAPPIGIGYNNSTSRLTYTWNDNNANSWDFPANSPDGDNLFIPPDEWTFVALSVTPEFATLYSGPLGGELKSATNNIPQLAQMPAGTGWRFGEDNCCGTERNYIGLMDDFALWNHALTPQELAEIHSGAKIATDFQEPSEFIPFDVGGAGEIGTSTLAATRGNFVYEPAEGDPLPGLGQSWYAVANPGNKAGVDAVALDNDRAVPYFHAQDGTWWTGSGDLPNIHKYPIETEGVITGDNYTTILDGEILIEESGTIQFLDGVDDFTYLAIDLDRSGTAGDTADEILINDNAWTSADSTGNGGAPIVAAEFENIAAGGEWLAMEFNQGEGGGGDSGMLYWDALDVDEVFPLNQGDGVFAEDAEFLQIPDTHLRGPAGPKTLISGDATGAVPALALGWSIDVSGDEGTSDQFVLENPDDSIYETVLDVEGVLVYVNPLDEVPEGSAFQIFVADTVNGEPNIVFPGDGWTYDPATGTIMFGDVVINPGCAQGDLDGNGTVNFDDFLILSSNFGLEVGSCAEGDIDGSGTVDFNDFLTLSGNFGNAVAAASVPEPSSSLILALGAMLLGVVRRRR